ncbi:MAG: SsrA-binding protein SmpB [Bacteroidetes bacterium]|nr:SsrA-binding protein [Rhodothermaceae bacterium RA]RMH65816.1 MAG: SsrA-binding protein SmpB [Bacteroidota bacterium]
MGDSIRVVTTNRKARYDFHIEETLEAGIVLLGTEVKAIREGRINLQDAFCTVEQGEMILHGCHISPYSHGNQFNHDPVRPRKLLLHRREIERWAKAAQQKQYTIVPLKVYFKNGFAKVEIGLARGKKLYDKRADIAEREAKRRIEQTMRRR